MKNINDFIDFVKIDYQDEKKEYGHYPLYMFVGKKDKKAEFYCLTDIKSVEQPYTVFLNSLLNRPIKIYLSIDFPKILDAKRDFILIHQFENLKFKTFAIPYCTKTGKRFPIEKNEIYVINLDKQLQNFIMYKIKEVMKK